MFVGENTLRSMLYTTDVYAPSKFSSRFLYVVFVLLTSAAVFVSAEDGQLLCWGWNKYGQV